MRIPVALACASMLIGCAREEPAPASTDPSPRTEIEPTAIPDTATPASFEPLPASYAGVLPCADCAALRYDIDLRPENVFFLRMTYQGTTPERSYDDIGAWSLASDLRTLALRGARQAPLLFSIVDGATLRKLDNEGQRIESDLNYTLERTPTYQSLNPRVPLRGMYSVTDAGAILEECTTGMKLTLEPSSTASLHQEYVSLSKNASRPMLLAVEGRIETTDRSAARLTATSTARFWPGESCGARGVTHDLEGSRWVLVRLGDRAVPPEEGKPEPYFVLQPSTKQMAGHGGCNRLSGGYEIKGDALQLGDVTTTRMACPESETETAFLNALESVERWQLRENQLVLLDKNNVAVAQLESRNL